MSVKKTVLEIVGILEKHLRRSLSFSKPSYLLKMNSFIIIFERFLSEVITTFVRLVFQKQLSAIPF